MRVGFLAGALALAAAPALSQTPTPEPPPGNYPPQQYNSFENSPFVGRDGVRRCFSIGAVTVADRAAARTVFLQDRKGVIFRVDLAEPCGALDAAQEIHVRIRGRLDVCVGGAATMVVKTSVGAKRCEIEQVLRPTKAEATRLASATQR